VDKDDRMATAPTMVVDFDGTLAVQDVGDELCETFAEPGWRSHGAAWRRGELSLPDAQRRMWASVRADGPALVARAREVGALRDGAERLFEAARRGDLRLVLASGGFGLYVEAILGDRLSLFDAAYYNRLEPGPNGPELSFPHRALARGPYAICKAAVCEQHRASTFCGDGSSDRSVAGSVPTIFAVRESLLSLHCNERGIPCVPFTTFDEVLDHLGVAPTP
jgi:HAD superfamily phosphoserine phosphatase-like hydrolase